MTARDGGCGVDAMDAADYVAQAGKKRNKYRAEPVEEDGFRFASKAELRRYRELRLMRSAGEIVALEVHPVFRLEVNGVRIGRYTADFRYLTKDGELVVEDVKGAISRDYPMRKKLIKALYGIEIVEVKA